MGKHAYLILAHKNLKQLQKLIELLDHPRNDIYLHIDSKVKDFIPETFKSVCKYSSLIILPERLNVNWGGVSIMRAELALLKNSVGKGPYDYYHLLSGMDLPLKRQNDIHAFFDKHKGKEFISLWKFKKSTLSRFRYYTIFPEGESKFRTRIVNHIFKGLQMVCGFRINRQVSFRFGSQWFSITDDLARYILDKEQWLEKVFGHTSTCDEIFIQTLVCNSRFKDHLFVSEPVASNRESTLGNMRFIDWTRGDSVRHPWTFRVDDETLLDSVEHLWARKFDETVDGEIIDRIYDRLMYSDTDLEVGKDKS
ncbi:MAG: beta-1,6-N-acetylglucosaminyltransferase [Muribaculaceae bacterium]|nr:beta-1,6-N-acetylglucosaminyltransferase [Muribaculaceae bacterium]